MKNSKIEWCDHTFADNWKQPLKWNRDAGRELNAVARCAGCGYLTDDRKSLSGCKGYCQDPSGKSCNALPCPSCGKVHFWCGAFAPARRPRVFCASLADWLDDEVPIEWLADLLKLIHDTPNLDWLLLTKRPENFHKRIKAVLDSEVDEVDDFMKTWMVKLDGTPGWGLAAASWAGTIKGLRVDAPSNVWIGITVENQEMADKRIPELLAIPAKVRFLSCEPLLGEVDLTCVKWDYPKSEPDNPNYPEITINALTGLVSGMDEYHAKIDWIVGGGESGPNARPMHPDWARGLRDQCAASGVEFLFKQWGGATHAQKVSAGRLLDGVEHNGFPVIGGAK